MLMCSGSLLVLLLVLAAVGAAISFLSKTYKMLAFQHNKQYRPA
jgi:predicted MFS family arabinose efflux permease